MAHIKHNTGIRYAESFQHHTVDAGSVEIFMVDYTGRGEDIAVYREECFGVSSRSVSQAKTLKQHLITYWNVRAAEHKLSIRVHG